MMLAASIERWHLDVAHPPDGAIVLSTGKADAFTVRRIPLIHESRRCNRRVR